MATRNKTAMIIIIILLLLIIIFASWWFFIRTGEKTNTNGNANANTAVTNTNKNTNVANTNASNAAVSGDLIPLLTFTAAPTNWYEEVWYKAASSAGEVTFGTNGVTFTGIQDNSRSGIMTDVERDVTGFSKLNLHMIVTATTQTLTGMGWNGREAPVAVVISYTDVNGLKHNLLGEDPSASGQMLYRGFYYIDPTGSSVATNGVKVTAGQKYTYNFDLMTLDPKPATIHFVALEGAGWKSRVGTVHEMSLIGVK